MFNCNARHLAHFYLWIIVYALVSTPLSFGAAVNVDFGLASPVYSSVAAAHDSGTYWNAVGNTQPIVSGMLDSAGTATSLGVELDTSVHDITMANWTAPQLAPNLMRDYLYAFSPNVDQLWITGLDAAKTYDVYLYSQNGGNASAGTRFTVGGVDHTVSNVGNVSGFVFGGNYTSYSGVSPAADGRLSIQYSDTLGVGAALNGFQVIEQEYVAPEPSTPSRGRQIILAQGLQIQGQNSLRGYIAPLNTDRWLSTNFTTINFQYLGGASHTQLLGQMGQGTTWGRWSTEKSWLPGEATYAADCVSIQYLDEIYPFDPGVLEDMTEGFATWRTLAPNALTYTSFYGNQLTATELNTFMVAARPDMLMFDHYPGYHATRESWYAEMQKYRTTALRGYDGSGEQPIPYGQYMQTFRTSYSEPLPSETFIRRQQFASWVFGFSFVSNFVYSDAVWPPPPSPSEVCPVMFSSPGDTDPTPVFDYVAETNRQSRNLGPALIRMVSTDIRMIYGKSGGTTNPSISGISTWASGNQNTAGYTDYLTDIVPLGNDFLNPDYDNFSDTIIGYFKPLMENNGGYTFVDRLSFMIVNGAGNESGLDIPVDGSGNPDPAIMAANTAEALGEYYHVAFDFADSNIDSLVRLSRDTGEVELVPIVHYEDSMYYFTLYLPGGTGDLFAYWDSNTPFPTISGYEILPGDANGDGVVDAHDATILAANWLKNGGATWAQGDFNKDGNVDDFDATLLAANWSSSGVGASAPEPSMVMLLISGLIVLFRLV